MLKSFSQLRERARALEPQTVAVACAHDPHTLEAVLKAADEGLLRYVLIGHKEEILLLRIRNLLERCDNYERQYGCHPAGTLPAPKEEPPISPADSNAVNR